MKAIKHSFFKMARIVRQFQPNSICPRHGATRVDSFVISPPQTFAGNVQRYTACINQPVSVNIKTCLKRPCMGGRMCQLSGVAQRRQRAAKPRNIAPRCEMACLWASCGAASRVRRQSDDFLISCPGISGIELCNCFCRSESRGQIPITRSIRSKNDAFFQTL